MDELKSQLDKEYETQLTRNQAQLRALDQRHERDRDALRRAGSADEAKTQRSLQSTHDTEIRELQTLQKKEYMRVKDSMRRVGSHTLVS